MVLTKGGLRPKTLLCTDCSIVILYHYDNALAISMQLSFANELNSHIDGLDANTKRIQINSKGCKTISHL